MTDMQYETHEVGLHLGDSLVGDVESELLLCDGEVEPELAPGAEAGLLKGSISVSQPQRR